MRRAISECEFATQLKLSRTESCRLLAGTVTAFCGPIAFLGILVPHACRLLLSTADHRVLMPAVMIGGAALALGADLITHLPLAAICCM